MTNCAVKVVVASTNPVKVAAVREGFSTMWPDRSFEYVSVSAPSGVSAQPMTNLETRVGAYNRVNAAYDTLSGVYHVGIEGGLEEDGLGFNVFAWVVVRSGNVYSRSRTGSFLLPPKISYLIKYEGKELSEADDIVFKRENSKQQNGTVGILTHGVIDRTTFYREAIILALVPFKNPEYYPPCD